MKRKVDLIKSLDWWTILLYVILVLMGWICIYASVFDEQHSSMLDVSQRYGKQLMWIGAAFFIAIMLLIVESKFYSAFAYPIYILMIFLLIAVLFLGREVNGARSWFQLGAIRFQPAEFTKFATNLAIARYLSQYNFRIHRFTSLVSIGVILFLPALLILKQNDAGSALVYTVFFLMLYREGLSGIVLFFGLLAMLLFIFTLLWSNMTVLLIMMVIALIALKVYGNNIRIIGLTIAMLISVFGLGWSLNALLKLGYSNYNILLLSVLVNVIPFLIFSFKRQIRYGALILLFFFGGIGFTYSVGYIFNNVLGAHQRVRVNELLGIVSDPLGAGYNANQSKIAIGSGGFSGKGFLQGTQTKFDFVPEQSTDFIFCTVGEEWGFIGTTIVILLFLTLILRLIFLAERQRSSFSRIYGYGVACILFFHLAINVGMTIGLAPVIGIPLPFFSYGGSSLWSFTILLFIFLRLDANRLELLR